MTTTNVFVSVWKSESPAFTAFAYAPARSSRVSVASGLSFGMVFLHDRTGTIRKRIANRIILFVLIVGSFRENHRKFSSLYRSIVFLTPSMHVSILCSGMEQK